MVFQEKLKVDRRKKKLISYMAWRKKKKTKKKTKKKVRRRRTAKRKKKKSPGVVEKNNYLMSNPTEVNIVSRDEDEKIESPLVISHSLNVINSM